MYKKDISILSMIFVITFHAFVIIGWASNIYKFAQCDFEGNMKEEVIRGIGIPVFPLGVVTGYMDL
jgi:hypothetical protein